MAEIITETSEITHFYGKTLLSLLKPNCKKAIRWK
jgi:hypothetical protein